MSRERYGHGLMDHRKKQPNITKSVGNLAWHHENDRECAKARRNATREQIKYLEHLVKLAEANGIECTRHKIIDSNIVSGRRHAYRLIDDLVSKLRKIGVEPVNPYRRKYKFDRNGNICDYVTGKIVRKRV